MQRTSFGYNGFQALVYPLRVGSLAEEDGVYFEVTPSQDQGCPRMMLGGWGLQVDGQQKGVGDPCFLSRRSMDENGVVCSQVQVHQAWTLSASLENDTRHLDGWTSVSSEGL